MTYCFGNLTKFLNGTLVSNLLHFMDDDAPFHHTSLEKLGEEVTAEARHQPLLEW